MCVWCVCGVLCVHVYVCVVCGVYVCVYVLVETTINSVCHFVAEKHHPNGWLSFKVQGVYVCMCVLWLPCFLSL